MSFILLTLHKNPKGGAYMTIEGKLKSILEGTYIEETALTPTETDELYDLKRQYESEVKKAPFIKTPAEKNQHEARLKHLETRIWQLRDRLYTRE
jgi:hypothetical protein